MFETLHTILAPDFLLRYAFYTTLLVGFGCPLIGVFLVLRRLIFMGVALPQISSTGVALALSIPLWLGAGTLAHHYERLLAFGGSAVFSVAAILVLAFLDRRGRGLPEGRLGTAYAVSMAISMLLLSKNALAELGWLDMLKGEVVAIGGFDLSMTLIVFCVVLAMLWIFHKEFLLISYDRTLAFTLGKNVVFWDVFLYLLIGITVSMAVLSVGPLISFGFLVIPVLAAHSFSTTMGQLCVRSSLIGGATAFVGFALSYRFDFPVGPMNVALLGVVYAAIWLIQKCARRSPRA